MNMFEKNLMDERAFTRDELDAVETVRMRSSIPPKIFDYFVAVEQHIEIMGGDLTENLLDWMVQAYANRTNRGYGKETVVNAVQCAKDNKKLEELVKFKSIDEAVDYFKEERSIEDAIGSIHESEILYQDAEWIIVNSTEHEVVKSLSQPKWEVADNKYGYSHFTNNGGDEGSYTLLINRIFDGKRMNFMLKPNKMDQLKIYDGGTELIDKDLTEAIPEFLTDCGYMLNMNVKEALQNLSFKRRDYDYKALRQRYEESEYENLKSYSNEELVTSRSWNTVLKYVNLRKFKKDHAVEISDEPLKDTFNNSPEELVDAIMLSVPKWRLQQELGDKSTSDMWKYLVDNYNSIDFDALVDNMSYGYNARLIDMVRAKGGLGSKIEDIETPEDLGRALGIDTDDESTAYVKKKAEEIEDKYNFFDYVDLSDMASDDAENATESELLDAYGESDDDRSEI